MKIDKTLAIVIPVLIVLAILIALLFPWQCAEAQTVAKEDTLSFSVTYTPRQAQALQAQEQVSVAVTLTPDQQAVMQEAHGKDWSVWLHDRLREAARNHLKSHTRQRASEGGTEAGS